VTDGSGRALVSFEVAQGDQTFLERMHALHSGDDLYCIGNAHFHVYGVGFGDVVLAPDTDGVPT
jgi:hypothetical protein